MTEGNLSEQILFFSIPLMISNLLQALFNMACSSFMAQNLGARKKERATKSFLLCLTYSFAAGAVLGLVQIAFGNGFLKIFTSDNAVAEAAMYRLKIMGLSYAVSAFMDCTIAASRGIGKTVVPMIIVIMGSCIFRIVWVCTIFAYFKTITSLYLIYIFSWSITAAAEIIYFVISYKKLPRTSPAAAVWQAES